MHMLAAPFGKTSVGEEVGLFSLQNSKGMSAEVISFGAALRSLKIPDRGGSPGEVTLGFDSLAEYEQHRFFYGATIGRFANRIARGAFKIGPKSYTLAVNNGPNHLHGGLRGFDRVVWKAEPFRNKNDAGVRFSYRSPDGEEGYPGNLEVVVVYSLNEANELVIEYLATSDAETPINLTNHSFWNLAGPASGSILEHELKLNSTHYLPVNADLIPTGQLQAVAGGPMDFGQAKTVQRDIDRTEIGYDHCFVLEPREKKIRPAAVLKDTATGRIMQILTDKPAIQLYSGNFIQDGRIAGGISTRRRCALCLETEFYPDSPNQPSFPSAILKPGMEYRYTTIHRFSNE
jgi:aldose 1-epimerase